MKVLTATSASQGTRSNDFHWAVEGELVRVGDVCATDRRNPDGACGCGRAFSGLSSHKATTTAQVRDLPLSHDDVMQALAGYYETGGYGVVPRRELKAEVAEMMKLVSTLEEGAVVERRLDHLRPR